MEITWQADEKHFPVLLILGRLSGIYFSAGVSITWGYRQFLPSYLTTVRVAFIKSSSVKDINTAALRESLWRNPVLNRCKLAGEMEKIFFGLDWDIKIFD